MAENILSSCVRYVHAPTLSCNPVYSNAKHFMLCIIAQGKSGKYTNYSSQTGITTTEGQSTIDSPTKSAVNEIEDTETIEGVTYLIRHFANERLWNRFHTPRNIALALLGEVGELAELLQWKGDEGELGLSESELDKIGQELADVSIYLLRLADVCHIQLGKVTMELLNEETPP